MRTNGQQQTVDWTLAEELFQRTTIEWAAQNVTCDLFLTIVQ